MEEVRADARLRPHRPARGWHRWLLFGGLVVAGLGHAEATARCSALWAAGRALVTVELEQLLDPELLRLIRLGLEGRIRLQLSLVRVQPFWFDELLAEETAETVITFAAGRQAFVLEGAAGATGRGGAGKAFQPTDTLVTERLVLRPEVPRDPKGRYRVDVRAEFQVVTAQSLAQVARWMGAQPGQAPVPERVLQTLARDLTRATEGRCDVEQPLPEDVRGDNPQGRR